MTHNWCFCCELAVLSHRCAKLLAFVTTIVRSVDLMFFVARNNYPSIFFALFCTGVSSDPRWPFSLQFFPLQKTASLW